MNTLVRIGENLNVMSKVLGPAMKERNAAPIQDMARRLTEKKVDFIDVNIGPARKDGDLMMDWLVRTIQEVTDTPLCLDTTNMTAMEAGLAACKGRALINSVSMQSSRLEPGLKLAAKYNADLIALLWSDDGMPRDANERAMLMVDFLMKAAEFSISNDRIWVDPIVSPVSVEINQVKACVEFMAMVKEIAPDVKSTCGLSNVSNGVADHLRPWLSSVYGIMLMRNGIYSAIVDGFDEKTTAVAAGGMQDIVKLVYTVMDGGQVDMAPLSDETKKYVKTARVLVGDSLFSESWLEV